MGFSAKALVLLSAAQDGTSLWSYRTDDPAATVLKPSYFHGAASTRVRPGDRIQVLAEANAAPKAFDLVVLKVDGKKVETALPGLAGEGDLAEIASCLERAQAAAKLAEEFVEDLKEVREQLEAEWAAVGPREPVPQLPEIGDSKG